MPLAPPKRPQDLLYREVMTPLGAGRVKEIRCSSGQKILMNWEVTVWMDDNGPVDWKLEDLSLIIERECREMPPLLRESGSDSERRRR